jgi:hypothetical protein
MIKGQEHVLPPVMSRANMVSKADSASPLGIDSVFGGLGFGSSFGAVSFWSSLALRLSRLAEVSDRLKSADVAGSLGASCLFVIVSNSECTRDRLYAPVFSNWLRHSGSIHVDGNSRSQEILGRETSRTNDFHC